jgi:citrate lyase beta subunit
MGLFVCAGVAVVDGKLIEALHVDEAKRTLEIRKNLEALELSYKRQQ